MDEEEQRQEKAIQDRKLHVRMAAYGFVANEEEPYAETLKAMEQRLENQERLLEELKEKVKN